MANVKLNQKITQQSFKEMMEQKKESGLFVVTPGTKPEAYGEILGRVTSAFNLGKKVDVHLELYGIQSEPGGKKPVAGVFRFEQLADVYYLVRKE